jgi:2-methylcitrate dehydratase PrpD
VALGHFLPEKLKDPRVLEMAKKVKYKIDDSFCNFTSQAEIITKEKHTYSSRVDKLLGSTLNPLSTEDLVVKFRDCAGYSKKSLSSDDIESLITNILNLENVDDISEITDILE